MSAVHKASSGGTLATRRFVHAVAHLALAIQAILAFPALAPAQSPIGDGGWTLAFDHDSITTDSTAAFTQNQHQINFGTEPLVVLLRPGAFQVHSTQRTWR